jgi:hypothetical protein
MSNLAFVIFQEDRTGLKRTWCRGNGGLKGSKGPMVPIVASGLSRIDLGKIKLLITHMLEI